MSGQLHPLSKLTLGSLITLLSACEMGMVPMGTLVIEPEDTGTDARDRGVDEDSDERDGGPSGGDEDQQEEDDSSSDPLEQDDDWGQGDQCAIDGFETMIHQAVQDNQNPEQPLFMYQARSSDVAPFDELRIASYQASPYTGPTGPGSYPLAGSNYADCSLCVLVIEGCSEDYICDTVYFVADGTLDIDRLSMSGGAFIATLRDAVFQEVTIDPETYESVPVSGGENWCVDSMDIELPIYLYE